MILKSLLCAVRFLTILPFGRSLEFTSKELARSMAFYPLVGYFIGALSYGIFSVTSHMFAPALSTLFAFLGGILLTGALHLDGFADSCDGFYSGRSKEEILEVMRDSHIGTMAVVGLFFLLTLKLSLLISLLSRDAMYPALILPCILGRWVMVIATSLYPYARTTEGCAKPFVEEISWRESLVATLIMLVLLYSVQKQAGILLGISTLFIAILVLRWATKKVGGVTGDILGAMNEITEVVALLMLHWFIPVPKISWAI